MKDAILASLKAACSSVGISDGSIEIGYPENAEHGDFSTNMALTKAKEAKLSPKAIAEKIVDAINKSAPDFVEGVTIAGPGFINFKVKDPVLAKAAISPREEKKASDREVMVEYTDPNPFKEFHIGHLMSNAIGESIARLTEFEGNKVVRANWQGDVGPHVAKALWGSEHMSEAKDSFSSAVEFWGKAYAFGAKAYEDDPALKAEIDAINKKIYGRSDSDVNRAYDIGRQESLEAFERIYARLGTSFDEYFFESIEGRNGEAVVRTHMKDGTFEESEGAVVFKGEKYGLHTRVFITSAGLPTYETKELGLNEEKFKRYPDLAESIIITANEQSDYFKVMLKVLSLVSPKIGDKTRHISHGMMRFASGKMSSRKGNVVTAESLINEIKAAVLEKMKSRELSPEEADEISDQVAIAAIKYTILRQAPGGDVIFDSAKSISFEGDSGPYLQYSAVRANSVLEKAKSFKTGPLVMPDKVGLLERLLTRFEDISTRAAKEYAPQQIATYLVELAGAFNSFYNANVIIDEKEPLSPYRLALTKSFKETMSEGLNLLGVKVPKRM